MDDSTKRSNLACSPFAVLLLILTGSLSQDGSSVTYRPLKYCSLEGSSVTMYCTYTVPEGHTVTKALWFKGQNPGVAPVDLMLDPEYRGRVEYLGDSDRFCTLRISDLKDSDSDMYSFLFATDIAPVNRIGNPGVALTVTGLHVKLTPDPVEEDGWAVLNCGSCFLSENPTYTWYRNRRPLTQTNKTSLDANLLQLDPVGGEDEGSYTCAVSGRRDSPGSAATLKVGYGPQHTSVSVKPSGEIEEGSSVSLTCSSDASPPADKYTWYKKNDNPEQLSPIGSGQSYIITSVTSKDSGQYLCRVENRYGRLESEPIPVSVQGKSVFPWVPVVVVGAVLAAGALLVILICTLKRRNTGDTNVGADSQLPHVAHPDDTYTTLNRKTTSPDYDTLENVRYSPSDTCPQGDSFYENIKFSSKRD